MEHKIAIELKNICKYFDQKAANKNINLAIRTGEILSILGENGSGKTTLMNMISGIYFPEEGQRIVESHPGDPCGKFAAGFLTDRSVRFLFFEEADFGFDNQPHVDLLQEIFRMARCISARNQAPVPYLGRQHCHGEAAKSIVGNRLFRHLLQNILIQDIQHFSAHN